MFGRRGGVGGVVVSGGEPANGTRASDGGGQENENGGSFHRLLSLDYAF
jgi:hypothetical protein